jgi:hypothetical protein
MHFLFRGSAPDVPPTVRQLEVLEVYAALGSVKLTAVELHMRYRAARGMLERVRCHYGTRTTIQAYRAAVAARHIVPVDLPATGAQHS